MKVLLTEAQIRLISSNVILENKQLADKIYFSTGKLDQSDKEKIYSITHGDYTTKIISDIYYNYKDEWGWNDVIKQLPLIHKQLLEYNSNVFPIKDFDILNSKDVDVYFDLIKRQKVIDLMKKLPGIAIRNMKNDIRQPRSGLELINYLSDAEYFSAQYSLLGNRDEKFKKKIHNKMFKSGITLDKLIRFVDDKENLLGGVEFTREDIINMIEEESDGEMFIKYDKNNVLVVSVESADAIKRIGCNSFWCFTYGEDNHRMWYDYSYDGMVYVIINFNVPSDDPEFMHILIKPLESPRFYDKEDNQDQIPLFNMANDNWYNPYGVLTPLVGRNNIKKIFTFDI